MRLEWDFLLEASFDVVMRILVNTTSSIFVYFILSVWL